MNLGRVKCGKSLTGRSHSKHDGNGNGGSNDEEKSSSGSTNAMLLKGLKATLDNMKREEESHEVTMFAVNFKKFLTCHLKE